MAWEYWKGLLIKAGWAALYGAIAELVVTQNISRETVWVALVAAATRGVIIFVTTLKEETQPKPVLAGSKAKIQKNWKNHL